MSVAVTPKSAASILTALNRHKTPVLLRGSPGIGKTDITKQIAAALGQPYILKSAPHLLVEDFGIPDVVQSDSDSFTYKLPEWLHTVTDPDWEGWICFDEVAAASDPIVKCITNILDGHIHGHQISPKAHIVLTGNRKSDRAGASRILSHTANRVIILEMSASHEDWRDSFAIPNGLHPTLISFHDRWKGEHFNTFNPDSEVNATPRSWTRGVEPYIDSPLPNRLKHAVFAGAVGEGAATAFTAWMAIADELPDVDDVIANCDEFEVPRDLGVRYFLLGAVARSANDVNAASIVKVAERLGSETKQRDFTIALLRQAAGFSAAFANSAGFSNWVTNAHKDLIEAVFPQV